MTGNGNAETTGTDTPDEDLDNLRRHRLYDAIADVKCRAAVQLLLIQVSRKATTVGLVLIHLCML